MKRLPYAIIASLLVLIGSWSSAHAVSTFVTQQGGTGTTSPSGILAGDNGATSHLNTVKIGANLTWDGTTLSASGGSGSPGGTSGQVQYNASGVFGGVSTSTPSIGTVLTYSGTLGNFVGGTNGTFSIANTSITNAMLVSSTISGVSLGGTLGALTATNGTLTFSGSYTGAAAQTVGLNLANANTWTALQQFNGAASSTLLSANYFQAGATATTTLGLDGKITGNDIANSFTGRISPTRSLVLQTGTTTTWTASTTGSGYSPYVLAPFAGTLRQGYCLLDQSFLGVAVKVNGSPATPSYFVASTTAGNIAFTAGNTFTKGQKILMDVGTTTTATALSISCTLDVTETP